MLRTEQLQRYSPEYIQPTEGNPFGWKSTDRIGFFVAHPDDVEMMMGHAAMLAVSTGAEVHVYVASRGEASSRGDPDFVQSGGRQFETVAGITSYGVDSGNVFVSTLPDGELQDPDYHELLVDDVDYFVASRGLTSLVTLGENGGDGASGDHEAVHSAVMSAANAAEVWGLNSDHEGEATVEATSPLRRRKLGAVALNFSQFPLVQAANGEVPKGWALKDGFAIPPKTAKIMEPYLPFLSAETYDRYK